MALGQLLSCLCQLFSREQPVPTLGRQPVVGRHREMNGVVWPCLLLISAKTRNPAAQCGAESAGYIGVKHFDLSSIRHLYLYLLHSFGGSVDSMHILLLLPFLPCCPQGYLPPNSFCDSIGLATELCRPGNRP